LKKESGRTIGELTLALASQNLRLQNGEDKIGNLAKEMSDERKEFNNLKLEFGVLRSSLESAQRMLEKDVE